ncbi:hypothetical protein CPAST_c05540 [Clostridium pasteurianum DSM 525 = ATCC 6013]|uniref:Uncharacterized protein n=1 Tax=Clostridium pasteurianum DSM 525 = ATCC 6013 TaxID=1262449 RepID=A0A0H3J014_CLOPA|nr:hypothetical protein [Clostridium pasteurianum]AJA46654.1 hypothetical protein CPAST_c05540 [Clostridium pasteurianum DSM 525 = ATCC 6013]AJA50642.1 hypothetical protein CLPA_c05540 [Clostridium pasteurianum DSM 525 = ATCC 6013]AOZ74064.1 hypothetical protein AQ983_02655 [Clostridium pasteurianum DSM 525 = ATCC 6013]AOZ77861.1 hypothetical protein AQ984_02655 [Clostridium pasteurianum]ELP61219.1 hypothetical protein F502_02150 [Clostridium pasteurianum DSM 525 = ATCC 6013]
MKDFFIMGFLIAIAGISIIAILILIVTIFITSINGTIRIISVLAQNRNVRIIYIVSMALPVINIISMISLCYIANNKLKQVLNSSGDSFIPSEF